MILPASPWMRRPEPHPSANPVATSAPTHRQWPYPMVGAQSAAIQREWATSPAMLQVAHRAQELLRRQRTQTQRSKVIRPTQLVAALGGCVTAYVLVRILLGRFAHPPRSRP